MLRYGILEKETGTLFTYSDRAVLQKRRKLRTRTSTGFDTVSLEICFRFHAIVPRA